MDFERGLMRPRALFTSTSSLYGAAGPGAGRWGGVWQQVSGRGVWASWFNGTGGKARTAERGWEEGGRGCEKAPEGAGTAGRYFADYLL